MSDKSSEIRKLARKGSVKYTKHAIERIKKYGLTVIQVNQMLKNCNHNQSLDDSNGFRVEGRAPAHDRTGMRAMSAHVHLSNEVMVITVING
jgi:hypothetical protein